MDTTGIVIMLLCFAGPLVPPLLGTVIGSLYDAVTARRLRERRTSRPRATTPSAAR